MPLFLLICCLAILPCCQQKTAETNQNVVKTTLPAQTASKKDSPTRLAYPQRDSAGKVFYLKERYTLQALQAIKKQELQTWELALQEKFGEKFTFNHYNKYFNIAYRCSDAEAQQLEYVAKLFFQDVYQKYFLYEPEHPFQIVYFANKPEFTKHTKSTAYGFYQPATKTLFTYAHSGEGTLWHELMHAFVDANIDHGIQQWFSEGLASFYEMGGIHNNSFVEGYTNWRLPLLQEMLQNPDYLPLPKFMEEASMSEDNAYAKARFLFCYLWIYNKIIPFTKKYLYELSAQYKGKALGEQCVAEIERLVGKDFNAIEKEYKIWAMQMQAFQKLQKIGTKF